MKNIFLVGGAVVAVVIGATVWLRAATPTVGAAVVTPAYIVVNTPTQVTIISTITDPTVLPTGVSVVRTDAAGKTLSTVGVMHDDGVNGDVVAGDKTFSYRMTANESAVGKIYFRVSAAFKGVLQRSLSNVVAVTVDLLTLPPDPGEAGKQTLEGIDTDRDGVRDDLQRMIGLTYPTSTETRAALNQFVRSAAQYMIEAADRSKALYNSGQFFKAWGCLRSIRADADDIILSIEPLLKNTPERAAAFDRADSQLGGTVLPRVTANPANCSF